MTYMDVRFLVDDLNLRLKDAAPKVDTNDWEGRRAGPAPAASEKKGFFDKAKEKLGLAKEAPAGRICRRMPKRTWTDELGPAAGPASA